MNILIFGKNGYLGSYLQKRFNDIIGSDGPYDYVINCAGLVSVEDSELNPNKSFNSNAQVVLDLIKKYPESKLIHFSSYYVYDEPEKYCDEFSKTTSKYCYMEHKLISEKYALTAGGVCFRLGKLYGHPNNIQNKLTEYIIKSDHEIVLDDVLFNPTSLKTVGDVIEFELKNRSMYGLFNLSDDGMTTHFLYGQYIIEKLGLKRRIKHIPKMDKIFHNYGSFTMCIDKIKSIVAINPWTKNMDEYLELISKELYV